MHYEWNPFKKDDAESLRHHQTAWNFDERNESYYLGKINESGDTDPKMSYFTDGTTGRYYRKGEIIRKENEADNVEPFRNNSYEGKRKKNFSFKPSRKEK